MSSTTPKLRPHTPQLVGWCVEGLPWGEMQERLQTRGTSVALSTINRYCARNGFARLHPQSIHYDSRISRLWAAGKIRLADLKQIQKTTTATNTPKQ